MMTKRSERGKQEESSAQASQQEQPDWAAPGSYQGKVSFIPLGPENFN